MLARWKRLPLWARIAVPAAVLFLVVAAAGYGYFALRTSGAPPPAELGEAPEPTGGPSSLDGEWVLAGENPGFAGYRVREVLAVLPAPNDAVGRTTAIRGRMVIADGRIESLETSADLTQLRSDEEGRDPAAQEALATVEFPTGVFRLTKPIDLGSPRVGDELELTARGELTLHGITRAVEGPIQARWNGDSFQLAGQVRIRRQDFELSFPQQVGFRVSDDATIEVELLFVHPGGSVSAEPEPIPTGTETGVQDGREPAARGPGRLLVALFDEESGHTLIHAVNLDGSELTQLSRRARRPGYWTVDSHPVASPDGHQLLYSRLLESPQFSDPPAILVARADGTGARELEDADGNRARGFNPDHSADGQWIAWIEGASDFAAISVMRSDGSEVTHATEGTGPDTDPSLSPNGSRVAFSSFTEEGNDDIFIVNRDGSGRTRITSGPEYDLTPAWSPDGRLIAFGRDGDICVMAADGSDVRCLTEGPARDSAPSWSSDGRRIAFGRSDETGTTFSGPTRIIVMNANGSRERRVPLRGEAFWPSWLP